MAEGERLVRRPILRVGAHCSRRTPYSVRSTEYTVRSTKYRTTYRLPLALSPPRPLFLSSSSLRVFLASLGARHPQALRGVLHARSDRRLHRGRNRSVAARGFWASRGFGCHCRASLPGG